MKMLLTAGNLDFDGWFRGLLSAGISGGASAISGGAVVSMIDSTDFNFQTHKFYVLVGTLFVANSVVSIAKFLQAQPIPDLKTVTTTTETVHKQTPSTIVTSTVQETHKEPIDK